MKTKSDYLIEIETIKEKIKTVNEESKQCLFEIYKKMDVINDHFRKIDSGEEKNGFYFIDSFGFLSFGINVNQEILNFPFINDYLTNDCYYIEKEIYTGHKYFVLAVSYGPFISVELNPSKNQWPVYDTDTHRPLIKSFSGINEDKKDLYAAAVIELYQLKKGEFNSVIKTDYYGGFSGFFDCLKILRENGIDPENEEQLEKIINELENGDKNEN